MSIDLFILVIHIIVNVIFLSPALWLAGRSLVGKEKAKISDAVAIIAAGTLIGAIFDVFFAGLLSLFLSLLFFGAFFWLFSLLFRLIIWLALVKHFFDCGWLKALLISILAAILFVIIAIILGLLGFALVILL
jgi:hypothetical protein